MRLLSLRVVLIAIDLDETSLAVIEAGRALAAAADAELHVVNVTGSADPDGTPVHELLERAGVGLDGASVHAVGGDPALAIGKLADAIAADVIVLGPHRHDRRDSSHAGLKLDTALGVAAHSATPCLVAHGLRLPLERVVAAVDLSETSRGALIVALSWASALRGKRARAGGGVNLVALHVVDPSTNTDDLPALHESLERQIDDLRDDAGSWANVVIESDVIAGENVAATIARYAAEHGAGLLVAGTRGADLDTDERLGSVAAAVARRADVPMLLVPPAIWLELGQVRPNRRARRA